MAENGQSMFFSLREGMVLAVATVLLLGLPFLTWIMARRKKQ